MRRFVPGLLTPVLAISLAFGLLACASGNASSSAKAPQGVAPPAGSKLAKVELGMNEGEVRKIMGDPDSSPTYTTGKAWIQPTSPYSRMESKCSGGCPGRLANTGCDFLLQQVRCGLLRPSETHWRPRPWSH